GDDARDAAEQRVVDGGRGALDDVREAAHIIGHAPAVRVTLALPDQRVLGADEAAVDLAGDDRAETKEAAQSPCSIAADEPLSATRATSLWSNRPRGARSGRTSLAPMRAHTCRAPGRCASSAVSNHRADASARPRGAPMRRGGGLPRSQGGLRGRPR